MRRVLTTTIVAAALTGCLGILDPDPGDDLEYLVERFEVEFEEVDWAPFPIAHLSVQLALVNAGSDSVQVGYGACALEIEGVGAGANVGRGPWRSVSHDTWPSSIGRACLAYAATAHMAPGDTLRPSELNRSFRLAEILADSLPAGSYDFQALVRIGRSPRVPLGEVHLPSSRFPLPERIAHRDGFRYEVSVDAGEAADGGAARVGLDVAFSAPAHVGRLERSVSATCPVRILAFRRATDPTTIPQPQPDWTWPETCDDSKEAISLSDGDSRRFDLTLSPDATSAPTTIAGQYYLVGVVDVDDRPIRLSLGTLEFDG